MAVNAIYQKYSDNVARNATWSVETGTPDVAYPASLLVDDNPAKVAKIGSTTAAWLADFGSAQRVDLVSLIHHTFAAGADVRIQANTSNAWGSPAFEASFTIPTWLATGTARRYPVNPWLDLTGATGYSATGWRYWRLLVTGNDQNVQLGQIWMSPTIRTFTRNMDRGFRERRSRLNVENRTSAGVAHITSRLMPLWNMTFSMSALEDALRLALREQWDDVDGRVLPWLFIPNGTENDAHLVRWATSDEDMERAFTSISKFTASIEEAARGRRPGV